MSQYSKLTMSNDPSRSESLTSRIKSSTVHTSINEPISFDYENEGDPRVRLTNVDHVSNRVAIHN